jgi:O-antigen/teichoic acid export membrane protein
MAIVSTTSAARLAVGTPIDPTGDMSPHAVDVMTAVPSPSRFDVPAGELKRRTLQGALARIVAQGTNIFVRIGSLMLLARLLDPSDFGLVNMVTVVTGLFSLFKDAGLSMITIQRAVITEAQLSTLFWVNLLVGLVFASISIAAAPALVAFYHEPRLYWIAVVMGCGFVVNAAGVQHTALLQRQMRFAALAALEMTSLLISIVVGVSMALAGYRHWALVGMAVSLPLTSTVGAWVQVRWLPSWPSRRTGLKSMMRFGGIVSLNGLIMYFAYNLDKLLLGRFAGAQTLGIYGRAYQLISIPNDTLQQSLGGVALSALSRVQHDADRFRSYFLKGYSLFLAITVPLTITCAMFASDIVVVLLGPKWADAAIIFECLAPTILALALINPVGWLLFAKGQIERSLKMAFVIAPLVIGAYAIGLAYGPVGVATAFSAMMMALTVPMVLWATHGSPVRPGDLLRAASTPLLAALVATAIVLPLLRPIADLPSFLRLVIESGAFLVSYALLLLYPFKQKSVYMALYQEAIGSR